MTRAARVAITSLFLTTVYLLAFFQVLSLPFVGDKIALQILPVVSGCLLGMSVLNIRPYQIPWWLLVSFGSYALWCLGWGLFTFRDCPEAYTELLGVCYVLP